MLAIRMQRTGRKGYASFRVIVQDSRFAPTSGRVVAKLGHHNPHTKETVIDTELAQQYLANGAQPSPRVVKLLKEAKVKLPEWVSEPDTSKKKTTKNPEKLRKNQPAESAEGAAPVADEEAPAESDESTSAAEEAPADEQKESAEDKQADDAAEDKASEEKPEESA